MNLFSYGYPGDRDTGPLSSTSSVLTSAWETSLPVSRYTDGLRVRPCRCKGRKKTADYECLSLVRHRSCLCLDVRGTLLFLCLVSILFSSSALLAYSISLGGYSSCCRPRTGPVIGSAAHSRRPAGVGLSLTQGVCVLREGEAHPHWLPFWKAQQRLSIEPSEQQVGLYLLSSSRPSVGRTPTGPRGESSLQLRFSPS